MRTDDDKSRLERSLQHLGEWVPQLKIAPLLRCALGESLCQEVDDHRSLPASGGAYFHEAEYDSDPLSVEDHYVADSGGGRAADWATELASDWLSSQARNVDQFTQVRLVKKSELVSWLRNVGAFADDPRAWRGDNLPFSAVPWGLAAVLARRSLGLKDAQEATELLRDEAERGTLAFRDREEGGRWVFLRTTGDDSAGLLDLLEKLGGAGVIEAAVNQPPPREPEGSVAEHIRVRHAELRRDGDSDYERILALGRYGTAAARYIKMSYSRDGLTIKQEPGNLSKFVIACEKFIEKYCQERKKGLEQNAVLGVLKQEEEGQVHNISPRLLEIFEQIHQKRCQVK